jgi:hypothetical protein
MSDRAYGQLRPIIDRYGSARATLEGVYAELPMALDDLFHTSWGTPRSCVYVGSRFLVHDVEPGPDTNVAAWTIYDRTRPDDINLAYCYFSVHDPDGPAHAGEFLEEYVSSFKGKALTDFDETVPRLESTIPITSVANRTLDLQRVDNLMRRIRRLYRKRIMHE